MLNCDEANSARLIGYVAGNLEFSHDVHSESFYKMPVCSERLSENKDEIIVTISERLMGELDLEIVT